jgi:hypothetical protein
VRQAFLLDEVVVERARPYGSMLAVCPVPGCTTVTMGGTCVAHDPPVTVTFERGRPYTAPVSTSASPATTLGG